MPTDLTDALLRCRPPQSKEELWWYCKEVLRVVCQECQGARQYWHDGRWVVCPQCQGEGSHGFHFGRAAVCEGHVAPLDVAWDLWRGVPQVSLLIANREGGKTRLIAVAEHLKARHQRITISHMGAIEPQALRAREWLRHQTDGVPDEPPFVLDARTGEPALPGASGAVRELVKDDAERVEWANGAVVEFLPGTMAQASGPHYRMSVLDEVDEAKPDVQQKFAKTATGHRAQFVMASTYSYATGTIAKILRESPGIPVKVWCIWEAMAKCAYDCDDAPLPDGTRGRCPLFEEETIGSDGRRTIVPLCGGVKARRSDGHIPVSAVILKWQSSNPYTRGVELLCRRPEMGMGGGLAYWAYAPENRLATDPPIRGDVPLELSVDFNPGDQMEMCWMVIQQAPPELGLEFWVVDEIIIPTAGTAHCLDEFLRRYGPGGLMLPEAWRHEGIRSGIWVYGDATGHTPQSRTGETDYQLIVQRLRGFPDFRLRVGRGEANPPLVDRLNRANELLWDPLTGRRMVRVAPRCVRTLDEFARMPLKPGTREKDKSRKMQQMGMTHLGDDFEYWGWKRFPGGLHAGPVTGPSLGAERRASAGLIGAGSERASAGYDGGGSAGLPPPWATGR